MKVIVIALSFPLVLYGAFIIFVFFEFSKDHSKIKEVVSSYQIEDLEFDFCYENRCYYKIKNSECEGVIRFSLDKFLNKFLDAYNEIDEKEVCNHYLFIKD